MLRTTIIEEITSIDGIPKYLAKRVQRECLMVRDKYDEICVEYNNNQELSVTFKNKYNQYSFYLSKPYPFVPPRVTVDKLSQNELFHIRTKRFQTILKYISGLDCLCCHSYLCRNNWSPTVPLSKVISQIDEYRNIKKNIALKIIIDQIKLKYLNRYIDLDSWVFTISLPRLCDPDKIIL